MSGDTDAETVAVSIKCLDCGCTYDPRDEGPGDHAKDCQTREALIDAGRWEEPQ